MNRESLPHAPDLRPYQVDCVARLRASYAAGHRAPILQLPTGAGKTVIFSHVAAGATAKGRSVLVVAHRRELIRQASDKLLAAGVPHGIIAAGTRPDPAMAVQVGSVQTAARRLTGLRPFDLIVVDEAHHARAAQYELLFDTQPGAKLVGVSATPARLDGRGLGIAAGGVFDDLISGPAVAELIAGGYLCRARVFAPAERLNLRGVPTRGGDYAPGALAAVMDRPGLTGDAVEQYRRRADHAPAIAFCTSIKHAEHVAEQFRDAGYRAQHVHGGMPAADRDAVIGGLGTGEVEVVASCDLISEGLDVPAVGAVLLLRPTQSLVLHMQQIGRGMRPAHNKDALIVLDHAGNTLRHDLPDAERVWSLDGVQKQAPADGWRCPECGAVNPPGTLVCSECDYERPHAQPAPRTLAESAGDLEEITDQRLAIARSLSFRQMVNQRLTEPELRAFAAARGYRRGWVQHRLREQAQGAAV